MFFASRNETFVALIDIGSSSVGVALCRKETDGLSPILWSHREQSLVRLEQSPSTLVKDVQTTLMRALLELSQAGIASISTPGSSPHITDAQIVFHAPWSYIVSKNLTYKEDAPFLITEDFLETLITAARKQAETTLQKKAVTQALRLVTTKEIINGMRLNGYPVHNVLQKRASTLELTLLETALAKEVVTTLKTNFKKCLPSADPELYASLYTLYSIMHQQQTHVPDYGLVTVTNEAIEVGIIQNGVLSYVSHIPQGAITLARDIAQKTKLPAGEVGGYLRDDQATFLGRFNQKNATIATTEMATFEQSIVGLFQRMGKVHALPKTLFVATDVSLKDFFMPMIQRAASTATGLPHVAVDYAHHLPKEAHKDTWLAIQRYFYNMHSAI